MERVMRTPQAEKIIADVREIVKIHHENVLLVEWTIQALTDV